MSPWKSWSMPLLIVIGVANSVFLSWNWGWIPWTDELRMRSRVKQAGYYVDKVTCERIRGSIACIGWKNDAEGLTVVCEADLTICGFSVLDESVREYKPCKLVPYTEDMTQLAPGECVRMPVMPQQRL